MWVVQTTGDERNRRRCNRKGSSDFIAGENRGGRQGGSNLNREQENHAKTISKVNLSDFFELR